MVATGWVVVQSTWLKRELDGIFKRAHFQERVSREREFIFPERAGAQKGGLVFKLGFQAPPQWWS